MSFSYSITASETFTVVHARYIASKVATDLMRFHRLYRSPSVEMIDDYELELVELLKHDVVERVVYGFKRGGKWTSATVRYKALSGGVLATDDDPGKIRPGFDITGAYFTSFLVYNARWSSLSLAEQTAIEEACPFKRTSGSEPTLEMGYWANDRNYIAGGRGLGRSTVQL